MSEGNVPEGQTPQPQQPSKQPTPGGPGGPAGGQQAKPEKKKKKKSEDINHVVIRPLPKAVFLYPVFIGALVCGFWQLGLGAQTPGQENPWPGLLFLVLLGLNLFVMAFEFSRVSSLSVLLGATAFLFLGLWIGNEFQFDIFQSIGSLLQNIGAFANPSFYFCFAGLLLFIFTCIYIRTRFDYWVVTHNELLHYHGIIGNVERYPAPNLRITKEIEDVFEFLLLQSGRLIIYPASELRTIVLDNVPRVNKIERALNELLSKIIVRHQ